MWDIYEPWTSSHQQRVLNEYDFNQNSGKLKDTYAELPSVKVSYARDGNYELMLSEFEIRTVL
jgi:hypothetical protein